MSKYKVVQVKGGPEEVEKVLNRHAKEGFKPINFFYFANQCEIVLENPNPAPNNTVQMTERYAVKLND